MPKGPCNQEAKRMQGGWFALCSNDCDVYLDLAVCYVGGEVVDIGTADGIHVRSCRY